MYFLNILGVNTLLDLGLEFFNALNNICNLPVVIFKLGHTQLIFF